MCVGAGRSPGALSRNLNVDAVRLELFRAQLHHVVAGAHLREHRGERLEVRLARVLLHCGLRAVRVAAKSEHQLHHLVEGTVTDDRGRRARRVTADERDLLLLADAALGCGDLGDVDAEDSRLVLVGLVH